MKPRMNYKTEIEHDACHPFEEEVVRLSANYLEKSQWPIERISVHIHFMTKAGIHSDNLLDLRIQNNAVVGKADIYFNALYIQQHYKSFFIDIVPHEIAHVLAECTAFKRGVKIEKHGKEWAQWLKSLSHKAIPAASGPGKIFDDRAIRLHSGGIPCLCKCPGDAGFHVVSKRSQKKISTPGIACPICKQYLTPTEIKTTPISINKQIEFIRDQLCRR